MNFDFNNTLGVGLRVFALFIPIIVIYTSILTVASKKLNFLQKLGIIIILESMCCNVHAFFGEVEWRELINLLRIILHILEVKLNY